MFVHVPLSSCFAIVLVVSKIDTIEELEPLFAGTCASRSLFLHDTLNFRAFP